MATFCTSSARDDRTLGHMSVDSTINSACFDPDFDNEKDMELALQDFESLQLGDTTSLHVLEATGDYTGRQNTREFTAHGSRASEFLSSRDYDIEEAGLEILAISRAHDVAPQGAQATTVRNGRGRLLISQQNFRTMLHTYKVPVAFLKAIARPDIVCSTGFRRISPDSWDHWCLIPVRTVSPCRVKNKDHTLCGPGSSQTDAFQYIHLPGAEADIRGSHIGLFVRHNSMTDRTTVIVVNLLDQRLQHLIEEPLTRVKAAIKRRFGKLASTPLSVHLSYLSSALRWWNQVLLCFNQQLVLHEQQLQQGIVAETSAFTEESKEINTSLHVMAAHLHRCQSELRRIDGLLAELQLPRFNDDMRGLSRKTELPDDDLKTQQQLRSQLTTITTFSEELERKIQNILTLLFNQIQMTNGKAMQAILKAAQEDNRISQQIAFQSHLLAQSMKNDSVAMKTIAILTMLFLPATSFAAILSMPFFDGSPYLTNPARAWIWAVVTVVVTSMAFVVFFHVIRQQKRALEYDEKDGDRGEERAEGVPLSRQSRLSASRVSKA